MAYFWMKCELKVGLPQEEIEQMLKVEKYTHYKNGSWGKGSIPYLLSDTFSIISDNSGVRLVGGRAILKKIAKTLKRS